MRAIHTIKVKDRSDNKEQCSICVIIRIQGFILTSVNSLQLVLICRVVIFCCRERLVGRGRIATFMLGATMRAGSDFGYIMQYKMFSAHASSDDVVVRRIRK